MQTADVLLLIALLLPAVVGVIYGFLNIAFSIIAWVLAIGVSAKFSSNFSPLLENVVSTPILRDVLAFVGLFIISLVIFTALGYFIVKLLGRTGLTAADRILGFFFGFGLGSAIVTILVFLAGFTALPAEPWWRSSLLIDPFQKICIWSQRFFPESVVKYHSYELPPPPPVTESGEPG